MLLNFSLSSILGALASAFALFLVSQQGGVRLTRRIVHIASLFSSFTERGALVSRIGQGSPAEQAGLKTGDVVVRFAGNKVADGAQLRKLVAAAKSGSAVRIDVKRRGRAASFMVTIGESPVRDAPRRAH